MPEKASKWFNSRMPSCDVVILTLKKDHNPENNPEILNPCWPEMGVRPLLNSTLFNTRLISG
jgi:hypothetical protein